MKFSTYTDRKDQQESATENEAKKEQIEEKAKIVTCDLVCNLSHLPMLVWQLVVLDSICKQAVHGRTGQVEGTAI